MVGLTILQDTYGQDFDTTAYSRRSTEMVLAPVADVEAITGYNHRSLSQIGLQDSSLKIIISQRVIDRCNKREPYAIWCTGGHEDVKIMLILDRFCDSPNVI